MSGSHDLSREARGAGMEPDQSSGEFQGLRPRARNALARLRITRRDDVTSEVLSAMRDLDYVGIHTVSEVATWAGLTSPQLTKLEKAIVHRLRARGWAVTPPAGELDYASDDPTHRQE